jgi:hypothetical protein
MAPSMLKCFSEGIGFVLKRIGLLMILGNFLLLAACGGEVTIVPATSIVSEAPSPTSTTLPTETPMPTAKPTWTASVTPKPMLVPQEIDGGWTLGGERNDFLFDILLLPDGGTLSAGQVDNTGFTARISPGRGSLIRTDAQGEILWMRDYGENLDAQLYSLIQVEDDRFVALGQIAGSYTRDEMDMFLIQVDGDGNEVWSHTYGGPGMDHARMVRQSSDGGFILGGTRADEYPTGMQYEAEVVVIKTDPEGNELWTQTYGNSILSVAWAIEPIPDGGYIFAGYTAKTHDDRDVLVTRIDDLGNVVWSDTWDLDPGERDVGYDLILASDGTIVIACIQSLNHGPRQGALIKVDLDGNERWVKRFGEEGVGVEFWDIMEDADGGYVVSGSTVSGHSSTTGAGVRHALILKTDADGEMLWRTIYVQDALEHSSFTSAVVKDVGDYIFVGQATYEGARYADMIWLPWTVSDE